MKDSDPRPMPAEVARAYRDPLELGRLFATDVFSPKDRLAVRDELLRRLVGKYGNAEIESGSKFAEITQRVARFKKNPWKSIDLLMSVPEYGGEESVKLELAHVMQPYWAKWWDGFEWSDWSSTDGWLDIAKIVLGDRQLRWLAAQYARAVIDLTRPQDRYVCLASIEAAEAYSFDPSVECWSRLTAASRAVYAANAVFVADAAASNSNAAAIAAAYEKAVYAAAYAAASAAYAASRADNAAAYAANVGSAVVIRRANAYKQLAELTRCLITPTLITSASRGLR